MRGRRSWSGRATCPVRPSWRPDGSERLLGPVRRLRVRVVVGDLDVAGRLVQRLRVRLLRSGVESDARVPESARRVLEAAEQTAGVTAAAAVGHDEHALDLGEAVAEPL